MNHRGSSGGFSDIFAGRKYIRFADSICYKSLSHRSAYQVLAHIERRRRISEIPQGIYIEVMCPDDTLPVLHQPGLSQLGLMVIDGSKRTAQQPACGVAHGDGDDLVADLGHSEQVDLPEHHEGGQHNDHGGLAVARAPEGTGIDLVEATQHIEGGHPPQQQGAILHHLGLIVEEGHDIGGKNQHRHHQDQGAANGKEQCAADALSGPLHLVAAQVLAHEGGGRQSNGLHGQEQQLVNLGIRRPAGHTVVTEVIDIGLDKNIGEGGDRHLDGGGDTHPDDLLQHIPMEPQRAQAQLDTLVCPQQCRHHQYCRGCLGQDRSQRHTLNAHIKGQDEHQIQHRIHNGTDHQEIEGPLGIAHRPEDTRADVIEHQTQNAAEIDGEIGGGFWQHILRGLHQPQHKGCHAEAHASEDHAQNQGHGDGGMDGFFHLVVPFRTVILADDHARTGRKAHKETDEHIDNGAHGAHGGVSLVADKLTHHPGIHGVVQLLEDIAHQQRQRKQNNVTDDVSFRHVHILAPLGHRQVDRMGFTGHCAFLLFIISV